MIRQKMATISSRKFIKSLVQSFDRTDCHDFTNFAIKLLTPFDLFIIISLTDIAVFS